MKLVQKRPSDLTIRIGRILFGLILAGGAYYNLIYQSDPIVTSFWGMNISNQTSNILKYILIGMAFVPIIVSIINKCIAPKKYIKIAQFSFGIILFIFAGLIKDTANLDFDSLVLLLAFLPLLAGITGKCIPLKCLKFGEKITKIRV